MDAKHLLLCPCGGVPVMTQRTVGNDTLFAFYCQKCKEETKEHVLIDYAVLDWNAHAEPEIEVGPAQKAFLASIDRSIQFHADRKENAVVDALKAVRLAAIEAANAERES